MTTVSRKEDLSVQQQRKGFTMRSTRRAIGVIAAATALATVLASCSGASDSSEPNTTSGGKPIKLAGLAGLAQDPYWVTMMCGGSKQAKKEGVSLKWYSANDIDTASAQRNFQAATLTKPSGMIIGSFDAGTFSSQAKTLMQQGTPVIAVDGPFTPPTTYKVIQADTNNDEFATMIADQVGDSGSFAVLGGVPNVPEAAIRWTPVVAAVKAKNANIKILPTQYDGIDRNKAAQVASALILAHPDLAAIYSISGPEGEGVASAVKQAGKQGKIKVYSYDANPAEVTALKAGDITALLAQAPGLEGAQAVSTLVKYLKAHPGGGAVQPAKPLIKLLPLKVLTKANIDDPEVVKYYLYSSTCDS